MNEDKQQKWSYSSDGECYQESCDTKEEAMGEGRAQAIDNEEDSFYIGKIIPTPIVGGGINAESIIEEVSDWHYGEYGEYSEDAYQAMGAENVGQVEELEKMLTKAYEEWATKYNRLPNWYHIGESEQLWIAQEDMK